MAARDDLTPSCDYEDTSFTYGNMPRSIRSLLFPAVTLSDCEFHELTSNQRMKFTAARENGVTTSPVATLESDTIATKVK